MISGRGKSGEQDQFSFTRLVRTEASESYVIFNSKGRVGQLNIHIQECVHGDLVIEQKLSENNLEILIAQINDEVISGISPREDFIFTVYQGQEIGFYSDIVDSSSLTASRSDIEKVSKTLQKVLGQHQLAKGQLNELIVCEFFKSLGYSAKKAPPEYDQKKIDVIARNWKQNVFIQVKMGSINNPEIEKVVKNVVKVNGRIKKEKVVAIVANSYTPQSEIFCHELEQKYKVPIWLIHKYQILSILPEYRRTIE